MSPSFTGMTIPAVTRERLRGWGRHPVIRELDPKAPPQELDAAAVLERIRELTEALRREGVGERTAVALFLENSADHLAMLFALFEIGAVPVLAKIEYRSLELDEIFANADPAVVVTEASHEPVLAPYLDGRHVILHDAAGFHTVQEGLIRETRRAADLPDGAASINYTYRGLGYPLGAVLTHAQYLHGARILQDGLYGYPGESMLFSIPISHIFTLIGCVLVPMVYGLTATIARTIHPRLIFDYFDAYHVEHVTAVPELYRLLHRARPEGRRFPALKTFVSGGSFLGGEEHGAITGAFELDFLHGYGLTEFAPASRNIRGRSRSGTIGPPGEGVECRIDSGKAAPPPAPGSAGAAPPPTTEQPEGEILLRTPTMTGSYYRRVGESRDACPDGWFRTGDIGRLDDGHLIFLREEKRTCKVGGIMVDLVEIERALRMHPEIEDAETAYVDGAVTATVGIQKSADFDELQKSIRAFLKPRLAAYKVPRRFYRR